jgi:hypothetical protein
MRQSKLTFGGSQLATWPSQCAPVHSMRDRGGETASTDGFAAFNSKVKAKRKSGDWFVSPEACPLQGPVMIRPKSLRNWRRLNLGFDAETTWPNSRLYGQLACWRNRRVPVKRGFYEKVAARRDQRASVLGKILSAMENSCEQCDAILLEYRIAYLDFWERASQETRDACKAVGELIGGSEVIRPRSKS